MCVCTCSTNPTHLNISCKKMTGRESQIPTGHLEHSPCHKVCASDAVQSVDNTAAHPNDPKRQTEGRVVPVCVYVCVCVCVCVHAVPIPLTSTFHARIWQGESPRSQLGIWNTPPVVRCVHLMQYKASTTLLLIQMIRKDKQKGEWCLCVCMCVCVCVCVCTCSTNPTHLNISCKEMTGRESQIPTGHLEHSPCHKVCASDAVQSVDNTAARPNDPKRQTAGRVVPVCVCVCVCLYMCNYYTYTFWQLQMSIAAHLFAFVCVCV